ncbi:hypothetical protein KI387_002916, partial [Taxus chinensis]
PPPCPERRLQDRLPVQGGGHETAALQRGGFVTEGSEAEERGKKGKTKGAEAKRGMRDVNAYPKSSFWIPNTLRGDLYHHWGTCYTVSQYSTLQFWVRTVTKGALVVTR